MFIVCLRSVWPEKVVAGWHPSLRLSLVERGPQTSPLLLSYSDISCFSSRISSLRLIGDRAQGHTYLVGVDGLQARDYPVHIGQG